MLDCLGFNTWILIIFYSLIIQKTNKVLFMGFLSFIHGFLSDQLDDY